jgi:hypothetical protein
MERPTPLTRIPGLGEPDVAVLPGILKASGIFVRLEPGFGEDPDAVLIREIDLPRAKKALRDYRIRTAWGSDGPIPW